jgi:uncharacterized membrane-anchored protein YhcB (DUF1043 family)
MEAMFTPEIIIGVLLVIGIVLGRFLVKWAKDRKYIDANTAEEIDDELEKKQKEATEELKDDIREATNKGDKNNLKGTW